jgi:hypothetical protein
MAALSLLDRSLAAISDTDLLATITSLPDDHREVLTKLAGPDAADGAMVPALRAAVQKGRINGGMEQVAMILSDKCLADCIEKLGESADNPSLEELQAVIPELIEAHGVDTVRVMMSSAIVGEAKASATLVDLLKHDESVKLPPMELRPLVDLRPASAADDAVKAARKERKERERAEARARREQSLRARGRL